MCDNQGESDWETDEVISLLCYVEYLNIDLYIQKLTKKLAIKYNYSRQ